MKITVKLTPAAFGLFTIKPEGRYFSSRCSALDGGAFDVDLEELELLQSSGQIRAIGHEQAGNGPMCKVFDTVQK